jgi:hypothetical protein
MGTFAAFVTFCAFFRPAAAANRPASILGPKKLGEKMPKIGILPLTLTLATIDSQKVTKDTKTNSDGDLCNLRDLLCVSFALRWRVEPPASFPDQKEALQKRSPR